MTLLLKGWVSLGHGWKYRRQGSTACEDWAVFIVSSLKEKRHQQTTPPPPVCLSPSRRHGKFFGAPILINYYDLSIPPLFRTII